MFCSQPIGASKSASKSRNTSRIRTETVFLRGIGGAVRIRADYARIQKSLIELPDVRFFVNDPGHGIGKGVSQVGRQVGCFLYPAYSGVEIRKQIEDVVSDDAISLFSRRRDKLSHPAASFDKHCAPP